MRGSLHCAAHDENVSRFGRMTLLLPGENGNGKSNGERKGNGGTAGTYGLKGLRGCGEWSFSGSFAALRMTAETCNSNSNSNSNSKGNGNSNSKGNSNRASAVGETMASAWCSGGRWVGVGGGLGGVEEG